MCTSLKLEARDVYFGRNMDIDFSYGKFVLTPRNYPIHFKKEKTIQSHYAIMGTAIVVDNYPLYGDAVNEKGLGIAGLNFQNFAYYFECVNERHYEITPYELILWILSQCENVIEAKALLEKTILVNIPFNKDIPVAELHWHIADKNQSIVLECTKEGMKVYDNPVDVLANNPEFDFHLNHLSCYLNLTQDVPSNCLSKHDIKVYSKGMGAIGLPGDYSSPSRFVKMSYLKFLNTPKENDDLDVIQFFHLLESVSVPFDAIASNYRTAYTSCYNLEKGKYYYRSYYNPKIYQFNLSNFDLNGQELIVQSCDLKPEIIKM